MNGLGKFQNSDPFNALTGARRSGVAQGGAEGGKNLRKAVRAQGERSPGRRARLRSDPAERFGAAACAVNAVARNYFPQ